MTTHKPRLPRRAIFLLLALAALPLALSACSGSDSDTPDTKTVHDADFGFSFTYPAGYRLLSNDTSEVHLYVLFPNRSDFTTGFNVQAHPLDSTLGVEAQVDPLWGTFRFITDTAAIRDTLQHATLGKIIRLHGIQELEDEDGKLFHYIQEWLIVRAPRGVLVIGHARPKDKPTEFKTEFDALLNSVRLQP